MEGVVIYSQVLGISVHNLCKTSLSVLSSEIGVHVYSHPGTCILKSRRLTKVAVRWNRWFGATPTELPDPRAGRQSVKMAHSCRWRFPARPGGSSNSGSGRKAGRIRVTASLRNGAGTHSTASGLGPGFDAAVQVSAAIDSNLQKFRDVLGESSGSSSGEEVRETPSFVWLVFRFRRSFAGLVLIFHLDCCNTQP